MMMLKKTRQQQHKAGRNGNVWS